MNIKLYDLEEDVSIKCKIGNIPIENTYTSIGYFKVTGTYKAGSAGTSDAYHISGMMAYAQSRYFNRYWIVDLSELSYVWGDDIDMIFNMGGDPKVDKCAHVVGPECIAAISTLGNLNASHRDCLKGEGMFDNISEAYSYILKIMNP